MKLGKYILLMMGMIFLSTNGIAQDNTEKLKKLKKNNRKHNYGIEGEQAPNLNVAQWVDEEGASIDPITLKDYEGKFKVIYCFQAWCPGCHSRGLPALQKMTKELEGNDQVVFLAIQTVFEGKKSNTFDRMTEIQKEYDLKIPFGHDVGDENTRNISAVLQNYHTGGTPWFIFIDQENKVVFNDYHLDTDNAIEFLQAIE